MTAHYAQSLVTDISEFERLAGVNRNLAQRLLDWLDEFLHKARLSLQGLSAQEQNEILKDFTFREVEAARKAWAEALRRADAGAARTWDTVRRSVSIDVDGNPFVVVDADILQGVPKSQWVKTVKDAFKRLYPDGIDMGGFRVKQNADSRSEYTNSKYTKRLRDFDPKTYAQKMRMVNNLGEIVQNAYGTVNEMPAHPRRDSFRSFNRGNIDVRIGNQDYIVEVVTAVGPDNLEVLYDIVGIRPTKITEATQRALNPRSRVTSANTNLPQSDSGVNPDSMQNGKQYSRPLGPEEARIKRNRQMALTHVAVPALKKHRSAIERNAEAAVRQAYISRMLAEKR